MLNLDAGRWLKGSVYALCINKSVPVSYGREPLNIGGHHQDGPNKLYDGYV